MLQLLMLEWQSIILNFLALLLDQLSLTLLLISSKAAQRSVVTFSNESLGTIKDLQWNFGEGAEPQTAKWYWPA